MAAPTRSPGAAALIREAVAPRPFPLCLLRDRDLHDRLFRLLCRAAALAVILLLVLLVGVLAAESWPAIRAYGFGFLLSSEWDPGQDRIGALPFVWGTLVTSAVAMLLAVPLGVGTAAFLAELAPAWLRRLGSFLIELLAAVPSVVYGLWGFGFLRPGVLLVLNGLRGPFEALARVSGFGWVYVPNPSGLGLLAAGTVLALMVVPYVTAVSFDACRAVPRSQREGALALGSTRWQMIWSAVLPYARPGIVGGCFLALGRALGETMAVLMLIGNDEVLSLSPFGTGSTIASALAVHLNESTDPLKRSALVELGLVLLVVTVVVNCLARALIWRMGRPAPRRSLFGRLLNLARRPHAAAAKGELTEAETVRLRRGNRSALWSDRLMTAALAGCFALTAGPLFLILGYIASRGVTALNVSFFTNLPLDDPPGLRHALVGSFLMVGLATLFAVPLGVLAAVFLAEDRRSRLGPAVRFAGELLGGVPSILVGVCGYVLIVLPLGHFSGWAGSFALAAMMVPIVLRAGEEALKLVPPSLRDASYALGAAHWQTVLRVTLPAALPAVVTAVFLAVARIAGETAPLLLTADNTNAMALTPNGPVSYLTYYVWNYSQRADDEHQRLAWAAAFVLLAVVMLSNVGIRLATGKRTVSAARTD
ncbi:MAG TPA: phosphate ABC transporter permease subunit PstC [Gemmataceae bacterium]|nr:phosphate ABC transporter permease subunit PstC [Gemmataceae bacterium]